ncbi:unnamed protein product [Rangifer tarandus platyrhynchus]|uniref:TFIIS-type domain-containing protein n=1 Tax=Rangifer tarandus platyrhynchus TaxID=3082113 RepID=A0ABN8Y6D2_RANTA|nr:unnamed protein product [Rangifer tarandus platyrhynchus]
MSNYDTLQGGGETGGPIRPTAMVPAAQPAARVQGDPPVLYGLGSVGVTPGPALRAASTASTSRPAVNKGCVLYYGQDDLWAAQHSADSHLAREENDLTLQIFGNQKTGCMCVRVGRGGGGGAAGGGYVELRLSADLPDARLTCPSLPSGHAKSPPSGACTSVWAPPGSVLSQHRAAPGVPLCPCIPSTHHENGLIAEEGQRCRRFAGNTRPYVRKVARKVTDRKYPKLKEVDDVLEGAAAWENVDSTAEPCPKCEHPRAHFLQLQTRSADEPMTTFCKCCNAQGGRRWRD